MDEENITTLTGFIILGFSEFPELQIPLFLLFLLFYLIILMGNLTIITVTCLDPHLHTPMYFFLCNLSFLDICCTSVTLPKLLDISLTKKHHISAVGCFTQVYFFMMSICEEFLLLALMAFDRYVAICHPLRYSVIMNQKRCILMVTGTSIIGFLEPVTHAVLLSGFSYCGTKEINHFFCDLSALLKLSCTSTSTIDLLSYILAMLIMLPCFLLTLTSYVYIISAILRIRSAKGRRKAFSTCSSHLTVVILFYVTLTGLYIKPTSTQSVDQNKLYALLYNVLIPLFNPIIYSLKNRQVKEAIKKVFNIKRFPQAQKNIFHVGKRAIK
ncbi:olfactory receptor 1052-like [Microcaecilia unicolor]|uniref:Olfactory receptor 1052-like n=1 Tax=Microcaecilia unicolor TaxID=1415580 RepID=A0A6P7WNQ4_9AMPH|nr:olfactory receptor 1052-like [Microcaecilia unicolor]